MASGVLALIESNLFAVWLSAVLLSTVPMRVARFKRLVLVILSVAGLIVGPQLLLLSIPVALGIVGLGRSALISLVMMTSAVFIYPHFQSIPTSWQSNIPIASFAFMAISAWVPAVVFFRVLSLRGRLLIFSVPIVEALLLILGSGDWISTGLFTHPFARLVLALLPSILAGRHVRPLFSDVGTFSPTWCAITAFCGAMLVAMLPIKHISEIMFDEAHGKWETVMNTYEPNDFGRSANYTYSQLFIKAKNLVGKSSVFENEQSPLPNLETLLVVKMPAEHLSEKFSVELATWVERGGRLLVVADHTDLYDTTQHLNSLLSRHFGVRINSDATYNSTGMPVLSITDMAGGMLGRIDAHGRQFPWQTGASFEKIPPTAVQLMTYGPSFAESGDYSRPNRFGPFAPDLSKRFFNHSAAIAVLHGKGAVAVLLDSTPWSNFSVFREQYSQMLRGFVSALERPIHLQILGAATIGLTVLSILVLIFPPRLMAPLIGLALGCVFSAGAIVGSVSWSPHQESRDFGMRVVSGPNARLEFLKQILIPGERNYARIVSSLGKYGLMPMASSPGEDAPPLRKSKRWLFVEPSVEQLPAYRDVLTHLDQGGDIVVLFAPEQSTNPLVLAWLSEWGLVTQRSIGLSISDGLKSSSGSLLGGRSAVLGREIRIVTMPLATSRLNTYAMDQLLQTYTVRPTKMPRESGLLTVGFSADQFSDDSVGEVWEGIYPSSIGRLRERLLASVLLGEERPPLMPPTLIRAQRANIKLPSFMVLENGEQKLLGKFGRPVDDDETLAYFRSLGEQALDFIAKHCDAREFDRMNQCTSRLLGDDMIEWLVSWRSSENNQVLAVELLHERRMSGMPSTWNVLFGK